MTRKKPGGCKGTVSRKLRKKGKQEYRVSGSMNRQPGTGSAVMSLQNGTILTSHSGARNVRNFVGTLRSLMRYHSSGQDF